MTTGEGQPLDVIVPSTATGAVASGRGWPVFSRRVARAIAVGLVALWTLWAGLAWSAEPRHVTPEQFRQDLAAGIVEGFQVSSWRERGSAWPPIEHGEFDRVRTPEGPSTAADGGPDSNSIVVYWTGATVGSVHYLDIDETEGHVWPWVQELHAAQVSDQAPGPQGWLDRARPLAALLGLLSLALVLVGPVPKRGTRWAWFFVLGTGWGLGVVAYAAIELWRAGAPLRVPVLRTITRVRLRGWEGYLLTTVATTLLNLAAWGLSALAGTWWVPAS